MSFTDTIYLVTIFFVIVICLMASSYVYSVVSPPILIQLPANQSTTINTGVNSVYSFYDSSLPAIFLILTILSALLTVFLQGHPIILTVWLVISVMTLVVYDIGLDILNAFTATSLNIHTMDTSIEFYRSGIPKFIPIANLIIALVMLGKRGFT